MRRWGKRRAGAALGILLLLIAGGVVVLHRQPTDSRIWSWAVGKKIVVIDAGHGGPDPGAVGKTKVLEKDVTLAVAKRLQAFIQQGGGKPVMVREEDKDLGTASGLLRRKREDLAQRIQLAAEAQADVYLSIHANSFPNEKLTGPQTFYHTDSVEGRVLAQAIQRELNLISGGKRVAKANKDFFILKKADQAAVTVELGFLSNPAEEQLLNSPEYQQKMAWGIYQGLCHYFAGTDKAKIQAP
ncbi:N-acetylmuramoyl-L-alanine amidase [Acididesulfobacillus acetoxydans]|uniref:N-acetylmuramoyl-L-alanine amidase n=2 Tax=Acididesulfobacillus acetoxydans TaxID=1561005 RepID=A0A8S0W6V9_9FIRM|nr:N-acetylmuramoyl-L-alanine amidase [Acididesulfobacillus acetoxydans]CEJ09567.1 Germination-specific N-acetylmuramoyl-L-alanine amidase [Acididesulfobacillus acetoxydans]